MLADHGIAADFEGEGAGGGFDAQGGDVDGDAAFGLLFPFIGKPGGNGAKEGNVRNGA
jgi:hypothetical protein